VIAALLALVLAAAPSSDPGYLFARSLARAGPRPAGSAAERRAHARVEKRFKAAGLRIGHDRFRVPGHGRSRNVVGIYDTPASCLVVLTAHTDSVPPAPGADDNASGVGTLVALAPRLATIRPACDVWLIATGAEERPYTGQADHLGARAAVPRVKRRVKDLRFVLSLDEVKDAGSGNSDHREFTLAGLPAAKLGVPDEPCRHTACDTPDRLEPRAFERVRAIVERLLG
jgi:Zn-dependent M28 family amino/carboxypeptidase